MKLNFKMLILNLKSLWELEGAEVTQNGEEGGSMRIKGEVGGLDSTVCCEFPVREVSTVWSVGCGRGWRGRVEAAQTSFQ